MVSVAVVATPGRRAVERAASCGPEKPRKSQHDRTVSVFAHRTSHDGDSVLTPGTMTYSFRYRNSSAEVAHTPKHERTESPHLRIEDRRE